MPLVPTKGNLMARKRSLELAHSGFELMDRKRNILIGEIMSLTLRAGEIQERIDSTFREAYRSLQTANITLGGVAEMAAAVPPDDSVTIHYRSVMGVEIPSLPPDTSEPRAVYGFRGTNSALDAATLGFHRVKLLARELAEIETTIYRLAYAIKKTQKRASALQNIIIPNFSADVKRIVDALEEKEREEFSRLKVLKGRGEARI